jgi:hypothetical protein
MQTYILIILAFVFPFAIFLLLPLWRKNKGDASFVLILFSVFFWGVAIGSAIIYITAKYLFKTIDYWYCYMLAILLGLISLAIWGVVKKYFKIK